MVTAKDIEERMLSGQPFTYGGMCDWRRLRDGRRGDGDDDRLIDKTIQRLRRKGLIIYAREKGAVVWRTTAKEPPPPAPMRIPALHDEADLPEGAIHPVSEPRHE